MRAPPALVLIAPTGASVDGQSTAFVSLLDAIHGGRSTDEGSAGLGVGCSYRSSRRSRGRGEGRRGAAQGAGGGTCAPWWVVTEGAARPHGAGFGSCVSLLVGNAVCGGLPPKELACSYRLIGFDCAAAYRRTMRPRTVAALALTAALTFAGCASDSPTAKVAGTKAASGAAPRVLGTISVDGYTDFSFTVVDAGANTMEARQAVVSHGAATASWMNEPNLWVYGDASTMRLLPRVLSSDVIRFTGTDGSTERWSVRSSELVPADEHDRTVLPTYSTGDAGPSLTLSTPDGNAGYWVVRAIYVEVGP